MTDFGHFRFVGFLISDYRKSESLKLFLEKLNMIDITKISAETRWRLMRFAEAFDKRQNTLRVIAEPDGVPGSAAGNESMEHVESPFDNEFLERRDALKNCPELEVRAVLEQMDSGKLLEQLDKKYGPLPHTEAVKEEYTAAYYEMKAVEQSVVELGKQCAEYIKNLK